MSAPCCSGTADVRVLSLHLARVNPRHARRIVAGEQLADEATVRTPDGRVLRVDLSHVPRAALLTFLSARGFMRPGALGDLSDELSQLVSDIQAEGRDWFFARIQELSTLGVRWQAFAQVAEERLHDARAAQTARSQAQTASKIRDDLYWVVDTYLGGIESLPNVVAPRGPARQVAGPAVRPAARPVVGAVPIILGAIGIVSGAALVAYIASLFRDNAEFQARLEAALGSDHPEDFLPKPDPPAPGILDQVKSGVGTIVTLGVVGLALVTFWPEIKSGAQRATSRVRAA